MAYKIIYENKIKANKKKVTSIFARVISYEANEFTLFFYTE